MSNKREIIVGIYKITNLINGKAYIGQSVDIRRRWNKHRYNAFNPNSESYNFPICCALRKYGVENFKFEIIEECINDKLDEREIYWITYYDTYHCGYNNTLGGKESKKEPDEKILNIIKDLKNTEMSHREIAEKWGVSKTVVTMINIGASWRQEGQQYPIRKYISSGNSNICPLCGGNKDYKAIYCKDCRTKENLNARPTKDELELLIITNSLMRVGEMFNVSDNAIRKWCKAYDLPYNKKDIMRRKEALGIKEYYTNVNNSVGKKTVIKYDIEMNELQRYPSIVAAAQEIIVDGKSDGSRESVATRISKCCHGKYETSYGYVWKLA